VISSAPATDQAMPFQQLTDRACSRPMLEWLVLYQAIMNYLRTIVRMLALQREDYLLDFFRDPKRMLVDRMRAILESSLPKLFEAQENFVPGLLADPELDAHVSDRPASIEAGSHKGFSFRHK
jgi:hypothetical protein